VPWKVIAQEIITKKSPEQLRLRLVNLRRRFGDDLHKFPPCFRERKTQGEAEAAEHVTAEATTELDVAKDFSAKQAPQKQEVQGHSKLQICENHERTGPNHGSSDLSQSECAHALLSLQPLPVLKTANEGKPSDRAERDNRKPQPSKSFEVGRLSTFQGKRHKIAQLPSKAKESIAIQHLSDEEKDNQTHEHNEETATGADNHKMIKRLRDEILHSTADHAEDFQQLSYDQKCFNEDSLPQTMKKLLKTNPQWKRTAIPGTGNCQYYAVITALTGKLISEIPATAAETVMAALKRGIAAVYRHNEEEESKVSRNYSKSTAARVCRELRQWTAELARSTNKRTEMLPQHLWGNWDTLRWTSRLLGRPIFVISESGKEYSVATVGQDVGKEEAPAKIRSSPTQWMMQIQQQIESFERPIVLIHAGVHYDALVYKGFQAADQ